MSAISYIPDQPPAKVHASLHQSLKAMDKAHQCSVLWFGEVMRRRLFRDRGFSSINQYAVQELGFSKSRSDDFIRLAPPLDKLPVVRKAVESGELGYIPRHGKSPRWPHPKPRTPGSRPPRGHAKNWSSK